MKSTIIPLAHLGFHINALLDTCPDQNLRFAAIHAAADLGLLVQYLDTSLRGQIDLGLLTSDPDDLARLNLALTDAAEGFYDHDVSAKGRNANGLCRIMAIVLEAIQQEFVTLREARALPGLDTPSPSLFN